MTLEVALKALESDARTWASVSESLDLACGQVRGLRLHPTAFPQIDGIPLAERYADVAGRVEGLLFGGSSETAFVSRALIVTMNDFQSTDVNVRNRIRKAWKPL